MKYGDSCKAYLSAILDLSDKSIVSFVVGHSNNNGLVLKTFDIAREAYPSAKHCFIVIEVFDTPQKSLKRN